MYTFLIFEYGNTLNQSNRVLNFTIVPCSRTIALIRVDLSFWNNFYGTTFIENSKNPKNHAQGIHLDQIADKIKNGNDKGFEGWA